ncbi:MAG: endolytic transglycosylase MltG, partial [Hyphomicrobiales bacterium]|nr:endolytic transglycosylase MltG [Hyphomicrobiales bacterium]
SFQIVERLKADQGLTGELREVPPEGSLLPETYSVPRGSARTAVIEMMQSAQKRVLDQLWAERADGLPLKSPQEALVLASIVEKETGRNDERERVAAVFVNRLRQNIRLQSDPTILYGLAQGRVQWGKPIMRSEIQSQTAHNTYVIPGLPPTPICNPGRASIEATLKPANTKELFFVADGKGGHIFAETLKDHNANVAKWREVEKAIQQQRAQSQGAAPALAPTTTLNAGAQQGRSALGAPVAPAQKAPAQQPAAAAPAKDAQPAAVPAKPAAKN